MEDDKRCNEAKKISEVAAAAAAAAAAPAAAPAAAAHKKRLSHPDICVTSSSRRSSCQDNNAAVLQHARSKKFSLASKPLPCNLTTRSSMQLLQNGSKLGYEDEELEEDEEEDVTKSLETAVRKISRGNSPNPLRSSPNMFSSDLSLRIGGLSGLARGYEQYRESLTFLRPMVEFGEASSDDLSSEWESSSDVENNNNNNTFGMKGTTMTTGTETATPATATSTGGRTTTLSPNSSTTSPPPLRRFPLALPPISQSKVSQAKTRVRERRRRMSAICSKTDFRGLTAESRQLVDQVGRRYFH